jgi:predicted nucleic acid-binding protein
LLSLLDAGRFEIAVSVPLVFEYEDALARHVGSGLYTHEEVDAFLDYLCRIGHKQNIFFLWRPFLQDPKDDMILELAFAAGCEAIITHNQRDFAGTESLGVQVHVPKKFLRLLEESR